MIQEELSQDRIYNLNRNFQVFCNPCNRKHFMVLTHCPSCQTYCTPQPTSAAVADRCGANYQCDGCLAYNDHLR